MLHRLDETEVCARLVEARLVVEVEGGALHRVHTVEAAVAEPVVAALVALTTHGPHHLDDRVIPREREANLGRVDLELHGLNLRDKDLKCRRGEPITLRILEVDISGVEACREIVGRETAVGCGVLDNNLWPGGDDELLECSKLNVDGDAVELQGGEWERLA